MVIKMDGVALQYEFMRMLRSFHNLDMNVLFGGMAQGEYCIMRIIYEGIEGQEGVPVSHLNKIMKISAPAVSKILKNLEKKKYIVREVDSRNRRSTIVSLTSAGSQAVEASTEEIDQVVSSIITKFGEQNMEQMLALCNGFRKVITEELESCKTNKREKQGKSEA